MKRLLAVTLTAVLIFTLLPLSVFAANTGYSVAAAIECALDTTYTKSWTTSDYQYDCYNKVELPARGILTFRMDKPIDSKGEYASCTITVIDAEGNEYWKHSGYGDNKVSTFVEYSVGLNAGVYYVNIDAGFVVTSGTISSSYKFSFTASDTCEVEPNGKQKTANEIEVGKEYQGFFGGSSGYPGDEDWFKIDLKANSIYRIYMGNYDKLDATNWIAKIQNASGTSDSSISYDAPYDPETDCNYYEYTPNEAGTYYIRYYNYLETPIPYTLKVVAVYEDDADYGGKTGFSTAEAIECAAGTTYTKAWTETNYSKDCYNKITLPNNGILTFKLETKDNTTGKDAGYKLSLYDDKGTLAWDMNTSKEKAGSGIYAYNIGLAAGTYYMNIDFSGSIYTGYIKAEYSFSFEATEYSEREPNDGISTATPFELGNTYRGWYGEYTTKDDWFKLTLDEKDIYRVTIDNYDEVDKNGYIYFVDEAGTEYRFDNLIKYDEANNNKYFEFRPEKSGTYYIEIKGYTQYTPIAYAITVGAHQHEYSYVVTKEATCQEEGERSGLCTICLNYITETIPKTDHTPETVAATPATCTTDGLTEGTKCSVCGEWIKAQETVPATGHAWGEWKEINENEHQRVCANDSSHVETAAHNWDAGKVTKEPAPGVDGEKQYACADCGAVKTETIAALPTDEPTEPAPTDEPTEPAPSGDGKLWKLGDVNKDGEIKADDARIILRAAAKLEELPEFIALLADLDQDGTVNATDARLALRIAAKLDAETGITLQET
ncbi:MAG: dockerin type I repeat-containing protein [Clostridia bacterium]|nr:dockerin type I repeat-containing protein [Clostridia bacterium]